MRDRKPFPKPKTLRSRTRPAPARSALDVSHEFMDLALEAAHCRELPTFLAGLAARASEMLKAEWGAVGEIHGNKVELHSRHAAIPTQEPDRIWIAAKVKIRRPSLEVLPCEGKESFAVFYPI